MEKNAEIGSYIRQTALAKLAAQAMQSNTARFYFDHMIVKEPQTIAPTPWHQDVPYWPFLGKQICSIWVALTESTVAESAMEFVAGSHLDGNYYRPEAFSKGENNPNAKWQQEGQGAEIPDIEGNRDRFNIVGWDVSPGDAVCFQPGPYTGHLVINRKANAGQQFPRVGWEMMWYGILIRAQTHHSAKRCFDRAGTTAGR